jgi:Sec-independent protein translocase protein TatA
MDLFGIGLPEIIFILLLAFVIFGPKRIVEMGREAGKMARNLSKEAGEVRRQLDTELTSDITDRAPAKPDGQE